MDRLSRDMILHALKALADKLAPQKEPVSLIVMGGASIVLLYGARESTKDVDAFLCRGAAADDFRASVRKVANELRLPEDWLNDGAKGYVQGLAIGEEVLRSESLIVHSLAPQQLLAMKLMAWRDDQDIADARLLLTQMNGSRNEVWQLIEKHLLPGRELKSKYAFEDLCDAEGRS